MRVVQSEGVAKILFLLRSWRVANTIEFRVFGVLARRVFPLIAVFAVVETVRTSEVGTSLLIIPDAAVEALGLVYAALLLWLAVLPVDSHKQREWCHRAGAFLALIFWSARGLAFLDLWVGGRPLSAATGERALIIVLSVVVHVAGMVAAVRGTEIEKYVRGGGGKVQVRGG